jgi:hypothetical protein
VPFQRTVSENGELSATEQVQKYDINPPIDGKLFEKPADTPPPAASPASKPR